MRQQLAGTLLSAVGASPRFVDDVIGDLEELAAQRREAAEPSGRRWYAGEVLRSVPHALRDSIRGSAAAAVVDVAQKALAAWLLLGMLTVLVGAVAIFGYAAWSGGVDGRDWVRSGAVFWVLLVAITLRYLLLGYLTVWIDTTRPLITLLTVTACEMIMAAHIGGAAATGLASVANSAMVWALIVGGGLWRLFRASALRDGVQIDAGHGTIRSM